jgi:hypothetical protein
MKALLYLALGAALLFAGAPSFAAAPAAKAAAKPAAKLPPPLTAQNFYLQSGKYFGCSRTVKDQAGNSVIQFYDSAGRLAGTGSSYIGKETGATIVKYFDKKGKYLGYSTEVKDPDGESRTTYKMAAGIVFGTSVTRIDKASNDYVTNYFYASGKPAGYSRRAVAAPAAQTAQQQATTQPAQTAAQQQAAQQAAQQTQTQQSGPVVYSNSGDNPVLVPASKYKSR